MTPSGNTGSSVIPDQADGTSVAYRIVAYDLLGNEAVSGEFSYSVSDMTTTSTATETTTSTSGSVEPWDMNMFVIIGGLGGHVLLVVIFSGAIRRR